MALCSLSIISYNIVYYIFKILLLAYIFIYINVHPLFFRCTFVM